MKVLVTGAGGQLGQALTACVPSDVECIAVTREQLDICDSPAVTRMLAAERPDALINAAAFTAVDLAESQPEEAHAVNGMGPANLCKAARGNRVKVVHVSTDYVFDGHQGRPYVVGDTPNPLSQYGQSKLEGERAVLALPAQQGVVMRTSWLYGTGSRNFVTTVLQRLSAGTDMRVVADQIGAPTWTRTAARALWQCAQRDNVQGMVHWADAGVASWYDLAQAVLEEGLALGLFEPGPAVHPIATTDYPTPAPRPPFSVLDTRASCLALDLEPIHWREALRQMLREHRHG